MARVKTNGIEIEYDCFGASAGEPIVLISGLGMSMIRWTAPFCTMLAARGCRVIRFDNRDAGLSTHFDGAPTPNFAALTAAATRGERPHAPYTLHDMAADVVGLLDSLAIARAHMVGRSMGGMIAQLMASEHPKRTLSLTSIMSSTGNRELPPTAPEVMAALFRRAPHPLEDEEGFLSHNIALSRLIAGSGYPFDEIAQRDQALAEAKRGYNPAGFGRQIAAIAATGDLRALLATITAPTLVIHGSDDPLVPPSGGKDTAANIRGAELLIIEGMGHELPLALYETVADAIARNVHRASRGNMP
ncbi:alpha/beta fold hydrolase [Varunaivibrio sulfuroxidans]|uniref:Pimeloyl-ACP methyl ester carboxylesterase n=1 Tax=Varunaivibrio sulfuroxidans TaxID=1773489 RepID=A0A4R3JAM0_9PROT|nr:alpha/beta hydrolase [Varunaivibrio sulfuroxidans]TCS62617.1 pimeloyl-ACP methyl ester carboxylesterase [Varunaivibrio sulfuroxidans]WES30715.1 alpha/beta hydrolase [Varunaivibrio sulfuroxidans]